MQRQKVFYLLHSGKREEYSSKIFESYEEAHAECLRLAERYPNKPYFILKTVECYAVVQPMPTLIPLGECP